jgi:hypothetical protein
LLICAAGETEEDMVRERRGGAEHRCFVVLFV